MSRHYKLGKYGLGLLNGFTKYIHSHTGVPSFDTQATSKAFDNALDVFITGDTGFKKETCKIYSWKTGWQSSSQSDGQVNTASVLGMSGYLKDLDANVVFLVGTRTPLEASASFNFSGNARTVPLVEACQLPPDTILKYLGKQIPIAGEIKESVANFSRMNEKEKISFNDQCKEGISKLNKDKPVYIFAHSLGTVRAMIFLTHLLEAGKFPECIAILAGGFGALDNEAAKLFEDLGVEIINCQIVGDPVVESNWLNTPGVLRVAGKIFRARISTNWWYQNPLKLHSLTSYHSLFRGAKPLYHDIANGKEYPEQKDLPVEEDIKDATAEYKALAAELRDSKEKPKS